MDPRDENIGHEPPAIRVAPPGPNSKSWLVRAAHSQAPMGPKPKPDTHPMGVVFASGHGSTLIDVDGNRYVDLAAGFGSLLLGHAHAEIGRALHLQSERLWQAMGDLYAADARVALSER